MDRSPHVPVNRHDKSFSAFSSSKATNIGNNLEEKVKHFVVHMKKYIYMFHVAWICLGQSFHWKTTNFSSETSNVVGFVPDCSVHVGPLPQQAVPFQMVNLLIIMDMFISIWIWLIKAFLSKVLCWFYQYWSLITIFIIFSPERCLCEIEEKIAAKNLFFGN